MINIIFSQNEGFVIQSPSGHFSVVGFDTEDLNRRVRRLEALYYGERKKKTPSPKVETVDQAIARGVPITKIEPKPKKATQAEIDEALATIDWDNLDLDLTPAPKAKVKAKAKPALPSNFEPDF